MDSSLIRTKMGRPNKKESSRATQETAASREQAEDNRAPLPKACAKKVEDKAQLKSTIMRQITRIKLAQPQKLIWDNKMIWAGINMDTVNKMKGQQNISSLIKINLMGKAISMSMEWVWKEMKLVEFKGSIKIITKLTQMHYGKNSFNQTNPFQFIKEIQRSMLIILLII